MSDGPRVGQPAPDFTLDGWHDGTVGSWTLSAAGQPVVLAFYPADDSPVCTMQLCSYNNDLQQLQGLGAQVWGISVQDLKRHEQFARKRGLQFPLLADTAREVSRAYGVDGPLGIRRSVFVVDAGGVMRWRHVALLGVTYQSTERIAEALRALSPAGG